MATSAGECEGASIPPQYHPRLLPEPGGICANSIGHNPKRDDMWSTARVSTQTAVVEYRLRRHPEGSPAGGKCHLLHGRYPGGYGGERYSNAQAEGKHHPGGYDPLDRVGRAAPSNCEYRSGAVPPPST